MSETRWLTPDEMRLWQSFMRLSASTFRDIYADLKLDSSLTRDDYEVLVHLSDAADGQLTMGELSDRVFNSRSRLTQRIDRMEARGLVSRERCPDDKRITFARITNAGIETITAAAPYHVESVRRHLFDHLPLGRVVEMADILEEILASKDG